jgi:hypothetical protein
MRPVLKERGGFLVAVPPGTADHFVTTELKFLETSITKPEQAISGGALLEQWGPDAKGDTTEVPQVSSHACTELT